MAQVRGRERVRTTAALARALDASPRTIWRWLAKGLPRESDGSYDLEACRTWRDDMRAAGDARRGPANVHAETLDAEIGDERDESAARSPSSDAQQSRHELLARKRLADVAWREARARREQLTYEQAKGQLVDRDEVAELLRERALAFRRELEAMSRRLARGLARATTAKDTQQILIAGVHQVLRSTYERPVPAKTAPRKRKRR